MITFLICLAALIIAYFTYGRYLEKVCGITDSTQVPSKLSYDGVDYVPMPRWKTFLIQLLNIAGLGPIFGALLGATYGPVAFLWITLGGIFFGAMHDFIAGVISLNNNGASLPEIIGKYLGISVKQVMRIFTAVMMLLVGAVFMLGPAGLLQNMLGGNLQVWVWIIFAYYLIATLLPINKIIGNIYPIFGAALLFMAFGILGLILFGGYHMPELTTFQNFKPDAATSPIIPTMFITIACGAISGFHATQSPMVARCFKNKKESRSVFYGAMISESIIALIWAGIAMVCFDGAHGPASKEGFALLGGAVAGDGFDSLRALNKVLESNGHNAAIVVNTIAREGLGKIGAFLALLGVVAAPITSGDTAFRSTRLIIADFLNVKQKKLINRLWICIPIFAIGYAITLMNYQILWRYFSWANQTLAVFTLWAITIYLYRKDYSSFYGASVREEGFTGKMARSHYHYLISLIPAMFMTYTCSLFLFTSDQMLGMSTLYGQCFAVALTVLAPLIFILRDRNLYRKA